MAEIELDDKMPYWRDLHKEVAKLLPVEYVTKMKEYLDVTDDTVHIDTPIALMDFLHYNNFVKMGDFSLLHALRGWSEDEGDEELEKNLKKTLEDGENEMDRMMQEEKDVDKYKMSSDPRGRCVIINNMFKKDDKNENCKFTERKGSEKDIASLKKLFEWLKFEVEVHDDVGSDFLNTVLTYAGTYEKDESFDCFVCCILSHGFNGGFYCNDGEEKLFSEVRQYFEYDKCPSLNGKPKLFFVQACQVDKHRETSQITNDASSSNQPDSKDITNGSPSRSQQPCQFSIENRDICQTLGHEQKRQEKQMNVNTHADFFTFLSSTPGTVSFRDVNEGSWFIQELCEVFEMHAKEKELSKLCRDVKKKVEMKTAKLNSKRVGMMPISSDTLRRDLYFFLRNGFSSSS